VSRRIDRLVGPLSPRDCGALWGRYSPVRREALELLGARHVPPPPAVEDDQTIAWHMDEILREVRAGRNSAEGRRTVRTAS